MDDILVLTRTRWKLREAVKAVNQGLAALRLAKHPDKTFIGRIAKGFDFLGYHFSPEGLAVFPPIRATGLLREADQEIKDILKKRVEEVLAKLGESSP